MSKLCMNFIKDVKNYCIYKDLITSLDHHKFVNNVHNFYAIK